MGKSKKSETKEITVNNVVFAYYEIDGTTLFLKVVEKIGGDEILSEHIYIAMIKKAEKKEFDFVSYLNI